ncbi:GNAT family N-acetyltransferase [Mucilaginibacter sp. RS28]|uniref:GNAT family N-acetyltransferase n=1 Tax=Mucilaginibacter straminoryzae TaxID=2932774 RepID=A0A9X1X1I0_9SPHI|nr:GNAT family N-acetyltransferase [Mucilaginibacter straminoryzae]MCJ8209439.1 GNAT family N-acetyltransferase [Mucilaginibacter straminoryzae]
MNINLNPFPELTTKRLLLRKLAPQDAAEIFRLRSNEQVNAYLDRARAQTIEDAQNFIQKIEAMLRQQHGVYWAITLKDNPSLIGTICFFGFDQNNDRAEIGYELLPEYNGKGMMQEALIGVVTYGFNVMELKAIVAETKIDNASSIKLLERSGFEVDASFEESDYRKYILKNR